MKLRDLILFVLFLLSMQAAAKERPVTIRDMVSAADLIVIGVVRSIDTDRIATIDVEVQLLGAPVRSVRFIAFPTWICDDTRVEVGQRAFLAFGPRRSSVSGSIPSDVRQVLFSGAGEIEIVGEDAIVHSPPLLLPANVRGNIRERADGSSYETVLWSDLFHEITRCLSKLDACRTDGVESRLLPSVLDQRVVPGWAP